MEKNNESTVAAPAPKTSESQLALSKRDFIDVVAEKALAFIQKGELVLPKDYSVNNALKSAWLILQNVEDKDHKKALQVCTRDSIANSLLDMIVQGLNPQKKQNYFIVYGNQLVCQRSYFGSMAVAQMVNPTIGEFAHAVIYEGDTFKYGVQKGKKIVMEHTQDLDNVDKKKIKGAYCIALDKSGEPLRTEIMTIAEIHQAWKQSKMNPIDENGKIKESSTHSKFTADMAMKTVINKLCKLIINASSDNALLLDRINRIEELVDEVTAQEEIAENANKGPVLEIDSGEVHTNEDDDAAIEKEHALEGQYVPKPTAEDENARLDREIAEGQTKLDAARAAYRATSARKPGF